jgi:tetratricopeptide (TPR) repeat protein
MRKIFIFIFVMTGLLAFAQESAQYRDKLANFKSGRYLIDKSLYLPAKYEFEHYIAQPDRPSFEKYDRLKTEAALGSVVSGLRIDLPKGESEVINFIELNYPNPICKDAILELASYYYNDKRYLDAVAYYDKWDLNSLSSLEMSEASFKKGYSLFVQSKFAEAQKEFSRVKGFKNIFYYPVNYYDGMTHYFLNDYANAVESFRKAEESAAYGPYTPYYIAQIHFAQKEYDKLIAHGEKSILNGKTNNKTEIRQLLGQAYYINNDFARALPHLEYYEANTEKLSAEEFYQLAFTQYQMGKYEEAKKNFLELTNENSRMGQMANYYLADSYIKLDDALSARAAFRKVSQMNFDPGMQEEASFNYGKISAELNYDREAINVLIEIPQKSTFFNEAQNLINDILVNSGDYTNSIAIIESLPKLTPKLESTYQVVTLKRGLQHYQEGQFAESEKILIKSLQYPKDQAITAQSYFWLSQIYGNNKEYKRSSTELDKYFKIASKLNNLPEESSMALGYYYQAYNFLKLKDYSAAEENFKKTISTINSNRNSIANETIMNRILPDAYVRTGDALFKSRKYSDALTFYKQAIDRKQGNYVYALFQSAIIEGLMGRSFEKISTLETIRDQHRTSDYYDDALFALGDTYQGLGTIDNAVVAYQKLVDEVGRKSVLYNNATLRLGLITYNAGDYNKALTFYKSVMENSPSQQERNEALLAIEEIYLKDLKQPNEYIAYAEKSSGVQFSDYARDSINFSVAKNFYLNAEYDKAITALSDYLQKFPRGFFRNEALYTRADGYNLQKDYTKALQDYESLIANVPNQYEERALLKAAIISYNYTQNFSKSLQYYKVYETKVSNENDKYQAQLGALRSAFRVGPDSDVKSFGYKIINSNLATKDEKASAYYYVGKIHLKEKSSVEAFNAFDAVATMSNNNQAAEAKYLMAEILYSQGKISQAEIQSNKVAEEASNYPYWVAKSIILLSDIYLGRKDLINARAALEAVIDNFNDDAAIVDIAKNKLKVVQKAEEEQSRIKPPSTPGKLELQSSGGQE